MSQAEENFRSAVAILEDLARFDPNNTDWQRSVAQSYDQLAAMLGRQALAAAVVGTSSSLTAAFSETVLYYGKSLAVRKMLTAKDPENLTLQQYELGRVHANLATVRWAQWKLAQKREEFDLAKDMFQQARNECEFAREMFQQVSTAEPDNIYWKRSLALANDCLTSADTSLGTGAPVKVAD